MVVDVNEKSSKFCLQWIDTVPRGLMSAFIYRKLLLLVIISPLRLISNLFSSEIFLLPIFKLLPGVLSTSQFIMYTYLLINITLSS